MTSVTPYTPIRLQSVKLKTPNLIHDGNLTTMVYSGVITVYTYQMLMIFASKSCSTSTTTYCQDITVRTRLYVKFDKNTTGLNSDPSSSTFATLVSRTSIQKLLVTSLMGPPTSSSSGTSLEFNLHGFHWTTSSLWRFYCRPRYCRSTVQAKCLHSDTWHNYLPRPS